MKKLFKVTSFTAMLTLLRMAAGFVVAKIVAVYTGPSGLAMLGQLQSLNASLTGIVNAPVGSGVIRFTAENHGQGYEACAPWWRASTRWLVIILLFIIPVSIILSEQLSSWLFNNKDYAWFIVITALVLPFSAIGTLINSIINGQQQYQRFVVLGMIAVIISTLVMLVLISQFNLIGALLAASVQSSLIGLIMLFSSLRQPWFKFKFWWGSTELDNRKAIGGYVLMAVTSAITTPVALIMVRNILVEHVGWEQAGQWQAVWKISEVYLGVITMALATYYLPKLSVLKDIDAIRSEVNKTALVIIPIVSLMALTVYLLRDMIIIVLFTEGFYEAKDLFFVQLVGDVIKIASWLYAFTMLSRGATKWFMFTEITFSISFVLLCLYFVGVYGTHGANLAYLINYSLYFLFVFFNFKRFSC